MMPRQKVYGKRSRAIYDVKAANLLSPERHCENITKATTTTTAVEVPVKANEAKKTGKRSGRKALGERSNNEVVLPVEVIKYEDAEPTPKRKPRAKRRDKIVVDSDEENEVVSKPGSPRKRQSLETKSTREKTPKLGSSSKDVNKATIEYDGHQSTTVTAAENAVSDQIPDGSNVELEQESPFQQHCLPLLELTTHRLGDFATWSSELSSHFAITKIAEASFGEVYRLSLLEDYSDISRSDESVFKVIALQAPQDTLPKDKRKRKAALTKQEFMSKPDDVANEVKLLQRMSQIPGFTNFRDMRVLQGRPPEAFAAAFKAWNDEQKSKKKELSHFPDPSKKTSYSADQLWAVIEMQDAGTDLERMVENGACTSIFQVWDIFWQVVLSLAKGEEGAEFEHRDLHLGNICVRSPIPIPPTSSTPIDTKRKLNFTSFETTIIDYTISRCLMPSTSTTTPNIAYTNLLLDPSIFQGDSTHEYQYDIYRYMRSALYLDNALADFHTLSPHDIASTGRDWEQYHPQTNLVWLHLVLYKLLEQVAWPSSTKAPARKKNKGEDWMRWKRANDLEFVLLKVQDLLDPGAICANDVWCAGDLVLLALCEGWLDAKDVMGNEEGDETGLVSQLEGLELR